MATSMVKLTGMTVAVLLCLALVAPGWAQPVLRGALPGALSVDPNATTAGNASGGNMTSGMNMTGIPVYNASLIVPNVTSDCPVPIVNFPTSEFDVNNLVTTFAPLVTAAPPTNCTTQAQNLVTCAFDGTLQVQEGCCSTACATQLQQLQQLDCIPQVLALACNATQEQLQQFRGLIPPMIGAAIRCANVPPINNVTCPDGRVLPVPLTYEQVNATANATTNGTAGGAGAFPSPVPLATPAELAAEASLSPAVAPAGGGVPPEGPPQIGNAASTTGPAAPANAPPPSP